MAKGGLIGSGNNGLRMAMLRGEPLFIELQDSDGRPKYRISLKDCKSHGAANGTIKFDVPPLLVDSTFTGEMWLVRKTEGIPSAHDPLAMHPRYERILKVEMAHDKFCAGSTVLVDHVSFTIT
jgi:hypothetical protein